MAQGGPEKGIDAVFVSFSDSGDPIMPLIEV
jgi:hypothetical protein